MDDLRFIRKTMERAGSFTAVPGWGGVSLGCLGFIGSALASRQTSPELWLAVWLSTAAIALLVGMTTMIRKAGQGGVSLVNGPGRKFLLSFLPPALVGMALTVALSQRNLFPLLPGIWLLCYGAAVLSAGTYSVRAVPLMGAGFMVLGIAALSTPVEWGDLWLATGFGGLQIGFGIHIARRHGG